MKPTVSKPQLINFWQFPWPIMEVLIGGKSSIDLPEPFIEDMEDATNFVLSYGFDPKDKKDAQFMNAILVEAIHFIEKYLMFKEWKSGLRPPAELLQTSDPRKLLVWASSQNPKHKTLRVWSCAILRVMHTIVHIDGLQRLDHMQAAREQIIGRFEKAVVRDASGKLWLGMDKNNQIELEKIEWKHNKSRDSIILKLLHKPANVAETIYDLLGIRIITRKLSETLMAVNFLKKLYLVSYPNAHPGRARNNLLDIDKFKAQLEVILRMYESGEISAQNFSKRVDELKTPTGKNGSLNPHSASNYQSIQLTCRQRIRLLEPNLLWQEKIKGYLATLKPAKTASKKERLAAPFLTDFLKFTQLLDKTGRNKELSIFFPFEVQILDSDGAAKLKNGPASHDRYKTSQIRTVRRRILHSVLKYSRVSPSEG